MSLIDHLLKKRASIVAKWLDITLQTYPEGSQGFFSKKDEFGNPVGHAISEGIAAIYNALLEVSDSGDVSDVSGALDSIIKIRAIQDFAPSEAVSFVLGLKSVIREELGSRIVKNGLSQEWAVLDERIDSLALLGFDIYAQCRQKICDIRVNEVKRQSERLLKMAGITYEFPEYDGDLEGDEAKNGQLNMEAREH